MRNLIICVLSFSFLLSSCEDKKYIDEELKKSRDLTENNEIEKAIILLNQLDIEYPDNIEILLDRATYKSMIGRYSESLKDYQRVVELDSKNTLAYYNMGLSYASLGNHNKAVESFNNAIQTKGGELVWKDSGMGNFNNPFDVQMVEIRFDRGISRSELGDLENAFTDFSFCINNSYLLEDCYIHRGNIYARHGQLAEACTDLMEAKKNGGTIQADSLMNLYGCGR